MKTFVLVLALSLCLWPAAAASRIFCDVTKAQLTCHFPENLQSTNKSFCVYYESNNKRERALACSWVKGNPHCLARNDFEVPRSVDYDVAVQLPLNANGTFTCNTIPPNKKTYIQPCILTPSGKDATADPPSPEKGDDLPEGDDGVEVDTWMIAFLTFLALAVVVSLLHVLFGLSCQLSRFLRSGKGEKEREFSPVPCIQNCRYQQAPRELCVSDV